MDREERIARGLETGQNEGLSAQEQARLEELRAALGSEFVWEEPPPELGDRIMEDITGSEAPFMGRWVWAVAAAVALVLGTVGAMNLLEESSPSPAAVVAMVGTDLAPAATGTADLIPTPNGWGISFDVVGLPPAQPGTFYQAWVNNGAQGVAVGTFHMRGDEAAPIPLWAGVDLHEYRTLNVTLQEEGAGPEPSGRLVMTGTAVGFEDE